MDSIKNLLERMQDMQEMIDGQQFTVEAYAQRIKDLEKKIEKIRYYFNDCLDKKDLKILNYILNTEEE